MEGKCKHGTFNLLEGCPQCIGERLMQETRHEELPDNPEPKDETFEDHTVDDAAEDWKRDQAEHIEDFALGPLEENSTVIVNIAPGKDEKVVALLQEVTSLMEWADKLVIDNPDMRKKAVNDLSIMSQLKKTIETKRQECRAPAKDALDTIDTAFKLLSEPLARANTVTREKVLGYDTELKRRHDEEERINQLKMEAAKAEMELKGELSESVELVEETPEPPKTIRAELGSTSKMTVRKWELIDLEKVPIAYLMVDAGKVTKLVKAGIGEIPGLRIWEEETLQVRSR